MEKNNRTPEHNIQVAEQQIYDHTSPQQQINSMIESAPFPIAVFVGREMRIASVNQAAIEVWGKGTSVIGKPFVEVLPEIKDQEILERMDEVYTTGMPVHVRNSAVQLMANENPKQFYFNYSITPLFDDNANIYGVMNTAADVTDLNLAKRQLEFSEQNFRNMILQAPVAMCLLRGPEFIVDIVNEAMLDIWGKPQDKVTNKPVFEALPDAREQGLEQVMEQVYRTGEAFYANEQPVKLNRHGKNDTVYQNFVYQPYRDAFGSIVGVLALSANVTGQVLAKMELESAYEQIRLSKTAAQLGTFDLDLEKGTMEWDDRCRELFGISHNNKVTYEHDFTNGLHPDDKKRIIGAIDDLLSGRKPDGDYDVEYRTVAQADRQVRWIRAKGKMYFEQHQPKRFIGSVLDITQQKQTELRLSDLAEKQSRLAAIVNSSDDIIISKTLDGIITSWNPAAERAFGFSESEAVGCHISIVIPKERLKEEDYILGRIRSGKKVDHFETVRHAKNKKELQLSLTVSPVIDQFGNVIGASKIARDISEQIKIQNTAKNYTERLEIMNMVMSAVSQELELNKILQKVTDATTELTGADFGAFFYQRTDDHGETYTLFSLSGISQESFETSGIPTDTSVLKRILSNQKVVRLDDLTTDEQFANEGFDYGLPLGIHPVISYLSVPVTSHNGNIIGRLVFGHAEPTKFTQEHESLVVSIAAQTAISLDNAKLFEEVKALNDKKDEFIGLASHELKTPLASINGYLQILSRRVNEETTKKFLDKALNQVSKITSLVNDLLDVSKIEAGKLQLTYDKFDLRHIIEESIELIQHSQAKHTIVFDTDLDFCPIKGDAQRIEQVIINLLGNAIKYAPQTDRVEVALRSDKQATIVSVKDFGPGIANDKLKNIFTRFYRIDEASPNISGLGIGLYLAHEIISRHNGNIWVESTPGAGSTFYFSLPIGQ